ncbi:tRNA-dihydrouridine synthase, partial [Cardiobacterium hominis]
MPFNLGPYHYPQPVIVLAPMAGVSDLPFRRLCQQNGADYSTAEMISAKPELLHTAYSAARLQFDLDPRYPKIVQLVGGDAALLAEAAL